MAETSVLTTFAWIHWQKLTMSSSTNLPKRSCKNVANLQWINRPNGSPPSLLTLSLEKTKRCTQSLQNSCPSSSSSKT
eukprot:12073008-Ditylum_brightwellii.AAC.1